MLWTSKLRLRASSLRAPGESRSFTVTVRRAPMRSAARARAPRAPGRVRTRLPEQRDLRGAAHAQPEPAVATQSPG